MTNLCKRCPLQDLPLDQFITNNSTPRMPSKRPLSPGSASIFSPAKRRILNDEGLLASSSPSRGKPSSTNWISSSPGRKLDFSMGMDDPESLNQGHEKTLEFSTVREDRYSSSSYPCISSPLRSTTKLAPSPEFSPRSHPIRPTSPMLPIIHLSIPSQPEPSPSTDRHSAHYPGFDIFHDPSPLTAMGSMDSDWMDDTDSTKENIPEMVDQRAKKTRKLNATTRNIFLSPDEQKGNAEKWWHSKPVERARLPALQLHTPDETDMQIV